MPTNPNTMMKAVVFTEYGSPDVLQIKSMPKPSLLKDTQVLVRVRACSANAADWHILRGDPYALRAAFGFFRPRKPTILGNDFAGTVEAVGAKVTHVRPGDDVYGSVLSGAFAEYVCASQDQLSLKPTNLSFEEAAAIPCAGITALHAVEKVGNVQPGQTVLINGASGGVGHFAVQIAKSHGAHVTGVCSTKNLSMVHSIGADHVIDYTKDNFTVSNTKPYDCILDIVMSQPSACCRVLTPKGIYLPVGGPGGGLLGSFADALKAYFKSLFMSQRVGLVMAGVNREGLESLKELVEAGKVKPVIDRRYGFSEIPEAVRYLEGGHVAGKLVITV
ncbi:hypothetical protein HK104_007339 [Borealophlyctis nickersoniae]|nr:hypothetical protein HK104_007339 [Borealophlyctis nickersoniae]